MTLVRPGGRVGWQRQRAWMEVFSSAEMTYSPEPNAWPWNTRAYRSSTRVALAAKSGSRGKTQERCCHGLMASWQSQRRTVEVDTSATTAAANTRGRPGRGRSRRPAYPWLQNRLRHLRTVLGVTPTRRAINT